MFDFILGDGYPYPYPEGITEEEHEEIVGEMDVEAMRLHGVDSVEWRFEWTIQFVDQASYDAAKDATGWESFDARALILSIPTEHPGRGGMPGIIVKDKSFARWMIVKGEA